MSEKRIAVAVPDEATRRRLGPTLGDVELIVWDVEDPPLDRRIDLLVFRYMARPALLRRLEGLDIGVVQGQSLGFDGVAESLPEGLVYCNAPEVHEASTAELALALILASVRRIPEHLAAQRAGEWRHTPSPGLAGRTVLLIGVGGVGREIERRLEPFDVRLTRVGRTAREDERGTVHGADELPRLLPDAEIVVLAVPLSEETRHLASRSFLERMRPGALLVNVSRGSVVDTEALVDRLAAGAVTAALDVTDPEPLPAGHPLWQLPGALITPHTGGHTGAMAGRVDRVIRSQVDRLLRGLPPENVVAQG